MLIALFWLCGCGKGSENRRPTILLITVDTLRADHLGTYGYSKPTSPHIDRFAGDALVFESCFSHAPSTRPSLASLLTGYLPHETRIFDQLLLPSEAVTLAEILKREGYRTAAVVSNYVLREEQGFEQGFDVYDATMNERELVRRWPERTAAPTTSRAIEILRQNAGEELFLWIHYQDPHGPYTPPDPFSESFRDPDQEPRMLVLNSSLSGQGGIPAHQDLNGNRDYHYYVSQYDGEIAYLDQQFGRLVEALKETGLYDEALIVFTADHGEGMGEHDYYFAHIDQVYNGLVHVPLILKYGNRLSGREAEYVQQVDLLPTVLGLLGIEPDDGLRGVSLLDRREPSEEIVAEMRSPRVEDGIKYSLVADGFKLIHRPLTGRYELYDLKSDFGEERDLSGLPRYRERLDGMEQRLRQIREQDRLGIPAAREPRLLTDEERKKLESLGYTQ